MKRKIFTATFMSVAAAISTQATATKCEFNKVRINGLTHYHSIYTIQNPPTGYNHDKYGTKPSTGVMRTFSSFVSRFDDRDDDNGDGVSNLTGQPDYVAYHVKAYKTDQSGNYIKPKSWKRPNPWYTEHTDDLDYVRESVGITDPRIDKSYAGVGRTWNRGHLQMKLTAARISPEASCNTHFFWNSVPQAAKMNQGPWLDLEYWVNAAANKYGNVYVVTGPIFKKNKPLGWIGDAGEVPVAIPDALFKIVARDGGPGNPPEVLAFIYPNHSNFEKCRTTQTREFSAYDHTSYMVTVRDIQNQTDLTFFNNIPEPMRSTLLDAAPSALWDVEPEHIAINCKVPSNE